MAPPSNFLPLPASQRFEGTFNWSYSKAKTPIFWRKWSVLGRRSFPFYGRQSVLQRQTWQKIGEIGRRRDFHCHQWEIRSFERFAGYSICSCFDGKRLHSRFPDHLFYAIGLVKFRRAAFRGKRNGRSHIHSANISCAGCWKCQVEYKTS